MSKPIHDSPVLFVRRGEAVTGPFARALVLQRLALGRIGADDALSPDARTWWPAEAFRAEAETSAQGPVPQPPGAPNWSQERHAAWLRWIDERSGQDRRAAAARAHFAPRGPDRREPSGAGRRALFRPAGGPRRSAWFIPMAVVLVVLASIAALRLWLPSNPVPLPPLAAPGARAPR